MLKLQASEFILPKAADVKGDDACAHLLSDDGLFISVLCDGVGSALKGGAAARQSTKFFIEHFNTRPKAWDIPKTLITFTQHINKLLFKESMTQYEAIELLTTLCVVVIEGDTLYSLNLGDSRIYIQTNGELRQLSEDHTMDEENLSHVLTQACGLSEQVDPVVNSTPLHVNDKIILCSDGVSNLISDEELNNQINKGLSAKLIVKQVTKSHADNERDDASMQIFTIEELDALFAIKNRELLIPESLHIGDNFDGYTLTEPMMSHERIWKVVKDNNTYVMKFPMSADDETSLDEFVREAWYAKQITHKAFGDAWVPEDRTARYYLMELIEGTSLMEYLKNQTLSIDSAINLAKFLHKAEAHLLHLGLVHGDIKPENIIVYKKVEEAGVDFKMVDFGSIVEVFSVNSRAGTPTYLSPERFSGGSINEATEIFSIGVTLYWALTGKYPYGEIEPFQTPSFKQAKTPSKYNKNIPIWLDSIIMRAIEVKPENRYAHYSELFYELKSPENVQPYFAAGSSFIERSPLKFYTFGFYISLFINIFLIFYFNG